METKKNEKMHGFRKSARRRFSGQCSLEDGIDLWTCLCRLATILGTAPDGGSLASVADRLHGHDETGEGPLSCLFLLPS
jgi:hypothetical protein